MSKPVDYFLSLNAMLGVHGVATSRLQTNKDYWTCASALWPEIAEMNEWDNSLARLQEAVKAIPKDRRKTTARANMHNVPVRFLSNNPVHVANLVKSRSAGEAA